MADNEQFEEIFYSCKYFKNVTDMDMLRTAEKCEKLRKWLEKDKNNYNISHYMHFAYWLGRIEERRKNK